MKKSSRTKVIKIKINIFLIAFILLTILLFFLIYFSVYSYNSQRSKEFYFDYKGYLIEFRRPISNSYKVKVFPNESMLNLSTYSLALGIYKNLSIVILEKDNNQATAIQAAEIISKVKNVLNFELKKYNEEIGINLIKLKTDLYELNISNREYYVFLRSYLFSNETYIKVHRINLIEITGKNLEEFDLATIRFLISFLKNMKNLYK
ncbi:MAG: hypothetical protein QW367_01795 [Candidatus Aenigmatarchaeota archaeon]